MPELGAYCRAYEARRLRAYPGWHERTDDLRPETRTEDGEEVETRREAIADDDILYLQENFTVTDDIFLGEHLVFDDVTDEWKRWVGEELEPEPFEIPRYEPIDLRIAEPAGE